MHASERASERGECNRPWFGSLTAAFWPWKGFGVRFQNIIMHHELWRVLQWKTLCALNETVNSVSACFASPLRTSRRLSVSCYINPRGCAFFLLLLFSLCLLVSLLFNFLQIPFLIVSSLVCFNYVVLILFNFVFLCVGEYCDLEINWNCKSTIL